MVGEAQRIKVHGVTLDVTLTATPGPAVLLLHGFPDSRVLWDSQVRLGRQADARYCIQLWAKERLAHLTDLSTGCSLWGIST